MLGEKPAETTEFAESVVYKNSNVNSTTSATTTTTTTQSERHAPSSAAASDLNAQLRQLHATRSEANLHGANYNLVSPQLAERVRQMNRGDRSSLEVQRSLRAVKAEADTVIHMLRAKNDLDESVEILDSDDVHSHRSRADSEFYGRYANSMPPPLGQEKIVWDSVLALGPAMQVSVYKRLRLHLIQMSMIDEPISRSSSTTDIHVTARASSTSRGASPPPADLSASPAPRPPSRNGAPPPPPGEPARLSHHQQQQLREHLPWLQYDSEEAMETMKLLSLLEASHEDEDSSNGGGGAPRRHRSPRARSPDGRRRQYYRHANSLGHSGGGRSGSPPPRRPDPLNMSPVHANMRRDNDRRPLSPRGPRRDVSPRARRELSPRARRDLSPRRIYRDLSPRRGRRDLSPRGSRQDQSPRTRMEHSPRGRRPDHSPRGSRPDHSPRGGRPEHSPRGSRHDQSPRSSSPRGSSPRRRSPARHPRGSSPRGQGALRGSGSGARSSASQSGDQMVSGAPRRRTPIPNT